MLRKRNGKNRLILSFLFVLICARGVYWVSKTGKRKRHLYTWFYHAQIITKISKQILSTPYKNLCWAQSDIWYDDFCHYFLLICLQCLVSWNFKSYMMVLQSFSSQHKSVFLPKEEVLHLSLFITWFCVHAGFVLIGISSNWDQVTELPNTPLC